MYYDYIQISKINDFIFCPYSLYFHSIYEGFNSMNYKAVPQIAGKIVHSAIELKNFSTKKSILQSIEVFSEKYGIIGKIDIYNLEKQELVERKRKIKKIYDGYIYQMYAQKVCLEEMGFPVKKMFLYSMKDNKRYEVKLKNSKLKKFEDILTKIRNFDLNKDLPINIKKCDKCIYNELCYKN